MQKKQSTSHLMTITELGGKTPKRSLAA